MLQPGECAGAEGAGLRVVREVLQEGPVGVEAVLRGVGGGGGGGGLQGGGEGGRGWGTRGSWGWWGTEFCPRQHCVCYCQCYSHSECAGQTRVGGGGLRADSRV